MRHQRLEVDQSLRDESDRLRIRLVVAELESNVDLAERGVHERNRLEILADPDNEH